jgi:hypothetical protein
VRACQTEIDKFNNLWFNENEMIQALLRFFNENEMIQALLRFFSVYTYIIVRKGQRRFMI